MMIRQRLKNIDRSTLIRVIRSQASVHQDRDIALLLLMMRYPLALKEVVVLRWNQLDFKAKILCFYPHENNQHRVVWPLGKRELHALQCLRRQSKNSDWIFETTCHQPLGYRTALRLLEKIIKCC